MQVCLSLLAAFFVWNVGKAISFHVQPTSSSTSEAPEESLLTSRLRELQRRFFNKTIPIKEVQRYAASIYRYHKDELKKSIKNFQGVFEPHLERVYQRNRTKKIEKCAVHYVEKKMKRGVFPRRVKVGISCKGTLFLISLFDKIIYTTYSSFN